MKLKYINEKYSTLRQVLSQEFKISSRLITKLKKNNKVLLNNNFHYLDEKLNPNDVIIVDLNFEEDNSNIIPTKMNLNILYEDDCLLILNKDSGIPVHPSMDHFEDSLSNGVKFYFDSIGLKKKLRIVNRLDKNTSGIVIFAKNEYIQECLIKQMQNGQFKKKYIAFCEGVFDKENGIIDASISRTENSIIKRCINPNGQKSITKYKVIKNNENITKIELELFTGRTHQIRVHMSYINHPILGDDLYGSTSNLITRQALHAYKIEFVHPITKKNMVIESPLPYDLIKLDNILNK